MAEISITLKCCTRCNENKPATSEYFTPSKRGDLYSICKVCKSLDARERRTRNPEHCKEIAKRSRIKNRDKRNTQTKEWFAAHPDYRRNWDKENPDKCRQYKQATRKRYAEAIRKYNQNYYQQHKPTIRVRHQKWVELNRPLMRVNYNKRRASENNLPSHFRVDEWLKCLDYWGNRCAVCGRSADFWHIMAQEHWIPINDSRLDNPGTVAWNILPMCHSTQGVPDNDPGCNNSKWKHDPIDWLSRKLNKRDFEKKLLEINTYFEWVKSEAK